VTGDSSTFTWQSVAGRRYNVSINAEFQSAGSTAQVATLSVRTSANASINANVLRWTSRDAADQYRSGGSFGFAPDSTTSHTWKLSAVSSASASTQTIAGPTVVITDIGPT
jgi:hypothetical protein